MNILHIIHQFPPSNVGGTELYTQMLTQRLAQAGHRVTVTYPEYDARFGATDDEFGVQIRPIAVKPRSRAKIFLNTWLESTIADSVARQLDSDPPDIVHIQHLMGIPVKVITLLRDRHIPYVVNLHDYWFVCANAQLTTNYDQTTCDGPDRTNYNCARCLLARAGLSRFDSLSPIVTPLFASRKRLLQPILEHATKLIAQTFFVRDWFQEMWEAELDIDVIPPGIVIPHAVAEMRQHATATQAGLHIAYIGGLSWQKGVHNLIDAVNGLPHATVRLSIVGDLTQFPEYSADLMARATHPGIEFIGRIPHEAIWQILTTVDLVAVPTLWYETASLIVQEAFAAGVPVMASAIGVMNERVHDGIDGILVEPGNVAAWRTALAALLQSPEQLATLRAGIQPVYTIDENVAAVANLYANCLR